MLIKALRWGLCEGEAGAGSRFQRFSFSYLKIYWKTSNSRLILPIYCEICVT